MAFEGAEIGCEAKTPRVQALRVAAARRAGFQSLGEIPLQICCRCSIKYQSTQTKVAASDPSWFGPEPPRLLHFVRNDTSDGCHCEEQSDEAIST